jgi:4-nitrophenyl phosphatase
VARYPQVPLTSIRGFIVDLDGVLWRGGIALPGASEFIRLLEGRALPYVVATNDPTARPEELAGWLQELMMPVPSERVLTAGMVVIEALLEKRPRVARVLVIGTESLKQLVREAGFTLTEDKVEAVIATLPDQVNMSELTQAIRALQRGADFLAPNREMVYPSDGGLGAGDGMLVVALEAASGRRARVLGKPRRPFFRSALRRLGLRAGDVLVVGDNLKSDVEAGRRAGCRTALVLTGMTSRQMLSASEIKPDWVFQDLRGLVRELRSTRAARGASG